MKILEIIYIIISIYALLKITTMLEQITSEDGHVGYFTDLFERVVENNFRGILFFIEIIFSDILCISSY